VKRKGDGSHIELEKAQDKESRQGKSSGEGSSNTPVEKRKTRLRGGGDVVYHSPHLGRRGGPCGERQSNRTRGGSKIDERLGENCAEKAARKPPRQKKTNQLHQLPCTGLDNQKNTRQGIAAYRAGELFHRCIKLNPAAFLKGTQKGREVHGSDCSQSYGEPGGVLREEKEGRERELKRSSLALKGGEPMCTCRVLNHTPPNFKRDKLKDQKSGKKGHELREPAIQER